MRVRTWGAATGHSLPLRSTYCRAVTMSLEGEQMRELTERSAKVVWDAALEYLREQMRKAEFEDVDLDRYLVPPDDIRTMRGVYEQFLTSLKNRQAMWNVIGDFKPLKPIFFGFDPKKTAGAYGGTWENLARAIQDKVYPNKDILGRPRSLWVHFCKGALDGAAWLAQFPSLPKFRAFVERFAGDPLTVLDLPMMLKSKVHGFGFALACDFLKESGWHQYAKPDVHIKAILSGIGFCYDEEYATFKTIVRMADLLGQTAFAVDKVLWLIGSGRLYLDEKLFKTDRKDFVQVANSRLGEKGL